MNITSEMIDIIRDKNYLIGLALSEYNVVLLMSDAGGWMVRYSMFFNGKLLFKGDDYRPSILHGHDSIESAMVLLGFLTCQPGDTDPGYFANYTPEQLAFAESYTAESLKCLISDFENSDSEYHTEAKNEITASVIEAV